MYVCMCVCVCFVCVVFVLTYFPRISLILYLAVTRGSCFFPPNRGMITYPLCVCVCVCVHHYYTGTKHTVHYIILCTHHNVYYTHTCTYIYMQQGSQCVDNEQEWEDYMLHKFLTKKETYTRLNTYPHTYNNFRPHIRAGQMYIQICHNTCLVQKQTHTLCQNCAMVCSILASRPVR